MTMEIKKTNKVIYLGNYFGYGKSYDGNVIDKKGISNVMLASHGSIPKIIVEINRDKKMYE